MSSISVSSLVLGSLTVEVEGSDSTLALSVLGTAPASLTIELGTPGAQGPAATIAVGTTTTLSPGASATVVNAGTSSAATLNFGIPAGQTGATGSQGPAGNAATIAVGSTTTGAAGSSASVVNSGTSSAAVLQFTIPRGDVGATGATGATGPAGPGVAAGGTTGQFLSKASGTNYDTTWATIVPGDRYLTSSTTSLTINNGNKSLTIGTGLSYTPTQNITISYDAANHMHGEVLTYNSGTGALTVDVNHHTGSGTYSAWVVNVGGVTPATSTAWGTITGTLSAQTDLQTALDAKLAKASNLSDLASAPTARTNLGLGTAATASSSQLVPSGGTTGQVLAKASGTNYDLTWTTASASVAWGSITGTLSNQTDLNTALGLKAPLASPALTGTPTAPTATAGTSTTQIATTAFVTAVDVLKAPLASPTFTGTVTIPPGASISGYLTTASASSTYQTLSGMSSYLTTSSAASTYQTLSGMSSYLTTSAAASTYQPIGSYLTDAPSDGSYYVRKDGAWEALIIS